MSVHDRVFGSFLKVLEGFSIARVPRNIIRMDMAIGAPPSTLPITSNLNMFDSFNQRLSGSTLKFSNLVDARLSNLFKCWFLYGIYSIFVVNCAMVFLPTIEVVSNARLWKTLRVLSAVASAEFLRQVYLFDKRN